MLDTSGAFFIRAEALPIHQTERLREIGLTGNVTKHLEFYSDSARYDN